MVAMQQNGHNVQDAPDGDRHADKRKKNNRAPQRAPQTNSGLHTFSTQRRFGLFRGEQ
jgi:hypothetical protein